MTPKQIQNFIKKIEYDISGCWIWKGYINNKGYGKITLNKKNCSSHRVSYEYWVGKIPQEMEIDHLCRTVSCCNPTHLEPVTHKENMQRAIFPTGKDHHKGSKTHCKQGHFYSDENTYNWKGQRKCKICNRLYTHNFRLRKEILTN